MINNNLLVAPILLFVAIVILPGVILGEIGNNSTMKAASGTISSNPPAIDSEPKAASGTTNSMPSDNSRNRTVVASSGFDIGLPAPTK